MFIIILDYYLNRKCLEVGNKSLNNIIVHINIGVLSRKSLMNFTIGRNSDLGLLLLRETLELDKYLSVLILEVCSNEQDFDILGWKKQIGSPVYLVVSLMSEIY